VIADFRTLETDAVVPNRRNPRLLDPDRLAPLEASIREHGILQPLLVRREGGRYRIIAGERRWSAAVAVGLEEVPAFVLEGTDEREDLVLLLVENIQREDLDPIALAEGLRYLCSFGLMQEDVGRLIGKSQSYVANSLRLLKLPLDAQEALRHRELNRSAGIAIASHPPEAQEAVARRAVETGATQRQLERHERTVTCPECGHRFAPLHSGWRTAS
jgi:ParB family chromosome partitioning protein